MAISWVYINRFNSIVQLFLRSEGTGLALVARVKGTPNSLLMSALPLRLGHSILRTVSLPPCDPAPGVAPGPLILSRCSNNIFANAR